MELVSNSNIPVKGEVIAGLERLLLSLQPGVTVVPVLSNHENLMLALNLGTGLDGIALGRTRLLHDMGARLGNLLAFLTTILLVWAWLRARWRLVIKASFRLWRGPGMNSLYMVIQIPSTRKSIVWCSAVASFIVAKMGHLSMAMQSMGLSLMTETTCSRRKPGIGTLWSILGLAAVRLQVRIKVFAAGSG